MTDSVIRVAVVGHTNTGKTSLLRTLAYDQTFGQVTDAPGTTREVISLPVFLDGRPALSWFDTPGLEDSVGLRDWIDGLSDPAKRLDGVDRVERFLNDPQARAHFEQESRVLAQVLKSDALLYVVDARDNVLAKHRDELHLLQSCGKPVLPVLNFVASSQANPQPWIDVFARHAMHIHLSFDTISPPINGQQAMYDTLGQLLGARQTVLRALGQEAARQRCQRLRAAVSLLASLCVTSASRHCRAQDEPDAVAAATGLLEQEVRADERQFVTDLLKLYQFSEHDYLPQTTGWDGSSWSTDLFDKQTLKALGIDLGKGAAVGGAIGATFDVLTAGLSLGAGTAIGATAGSAWQGVGRWGKDLKAKMLGQRELMVGDAALVVLVKRNADLIQALERRGHAAQQPVVLSLTASSGPDRGAKSLIRFFNVVRRQSLRLDTLGLLRPDGAPRSLIEQAQTVIVQATVLKALLLDELHCE